MAILRPNLAIFLPTTWLSFTEIQTVILRCLVCLNLNWIKICFFSCLKKHHFTKVGFDTSEENLLSCFQNGYFFKILWWCHEPFNQVKCRWKNENDFWTFYQQKNWFKFVSFLTDQSLNNAPDSICWLILPAIFHKPNKSSTKLHLEVTFETCQHSKQA